MTSLADVFVSGRIDTSRFGSDIKSGMSSSSVRSATQASGKTVGGHFRTGFSGALRGIAAPLTAALGAVAVGSFFKDSIAQAQESAKVNALTAQVIKTTGGAAGVTAKQIGALSTAISNKVGIDDEAIQSGANLLLTFKNIHNEAGKGNDVFSQATQAVTDMSVALNQPMKSGAIQLGKALNDPVKGITALSRVGVSFTEQQKAQIAAFVKSGDTMKAQKIILGELKSEFGGAAAAAATPAMKAQVAWGNFKESVGTALLPVLGKLATWFTVSALPVIIKFSTYIQTTVIPAIGKFAGMVIGWFHSADQSSGGFRNGIETLKDAIVKFVADATPVVRSIIAYFVSMWPKIKPTIAAFVAGIKSAISFVVALIQTDVKILTYIWQHFGSYIVTYLKATFANVITVLKGVFKVIGGLFQLFSDLLHGKWGKLWGDLKTILSGVWLIIEGIVKQAWNVVKTTLEVGLHALSLIWTATWDGFKSKISDVWGGIKTIIASTWGDIRNGLQTAMDFVRNTFAGAFERARDHIGEIWSGLKALAAAPINFLITTIYDNGLRAMMNHIPGVNLPYASPIQFAKGGVMPGWSPGHDIHRFYSPTGGSLELSGGEGFLTPKLTQLLGGKGGLAAMERKAQAFATGGVWRPIGNDAPITQGLHDQYTGFPAIDFGHLPGAPVASVAPGAVSRSEDLISGGAFYSYGRVMQVIHSGFETLYAHLSQRLFSRGALVGGGSIIGLSGNVGNVVGSGHLHFGVSGRSPYDFVNGRTDYTAGSQGGGVLGGLGDLVGGIRNVIPTWLTSIPGKIDDLLHAVAGMGDQFGPWGSIMANAGKAGLGSAKDFVLGKIKGWASGLFGAINPFDTGGLAVAGGWMPKGPTPERVLSGRQTVAFERWMDRGDGGLSGPVNINVYDVNRVYLGTIRGEVDKGIQANNARRYAAGVAR